MRIFVKAKPNSKKESIEKLDETHFIVTVKEPPIKGLANFAISRALAKHFDLSPSQAYLVSGFASKQKVFEVEIG